MNADAKRRRPTPSPVEKALARVHSNTASCLPMIGIMLERRKLIRADLVIVKDRLLNVVSDLDKLIGS